MEIVYTIEEIMVQPTREPPKRKRRKIRNDPVDNLDAFWTMDEGTEQKDEAASLLPTGF